MDEEELSQVDNDAVAEALEGAANVLRTIGWCQGVGRKRMLGVIVGYCAIGALGKAVGVDGNDNYDIAIAAETAVMRYLRHDRFITLPPWNDEPGRTSEEVIETMLGTAKALRNGEL
jgi:hypothetical protein